MTKQEAAALNRCADFLARMIEKYGTDVIKDISKKNSVQESSK